MIKYFNFGQQFWRDVRAEISEISAIFEPWEAITAKDKVLTNSPKFKENCFPH